MPTCVLSLLLVLPAPSFTLSEERAYLRRGSGVLSSVVGVQYSRCPGWQVIAGSSYHCTRALQLEVQGRVGYAKRQGGITNQWSMSPRCQALLWSNHQGLYVSACLGPVVSYEVIKGGVVAKRGARVLAKRKGRGIKVSSPAQVHVGLEGGLALEVYYTGPYSLVLEACPCYCLQPRSQAPLSYRLSLGLGMTY